MAEWHLETISFYPVPQERASGTKTVINFLLYAVLTLQSAKSMFGLCFVFWSFFGVFFWPYSSIYGIYSVYLTQALFVLTFELANNKITGTEQLRCSLPNK